MEKYHLVPEQLLYENTIEEAQLFRPAPMSPENMQRIHTPAYVERLLKLELQPREIRAIGFPQSAELIHRERVIMQGTCEAAEYALQYGAAANFAGGTHHAFADRGEGFCLMNDLALAADHLLRKNLVQNILIFDLDVHQGNGTASIFGNSEQVFTFSMHGRHNYPLHKETSHIDVELEDGTPDTEYLELTDYWLKKCIDTAEPGIVLYLSGVDILATDKLGRLNVSREGCRQRDRIVFETCRKNKLPVCFALGGGYSPHIRDITEAHANTFRLAMEMFG